MSYPHIWGVPLEFPKNQNKVARPLSPLHFVRQPDETLNNCEIFRDEINLMMPSKPYRG
ncbi:MAG: hypothetical protein ACI9EW_001451, partial [Cellvibrionaceae bacterium]